MPGEIVDRGRALVAQIDREFIRLRPAKALQRLASYVFFEGRPLTTRGRWINPLILGGLRGLSRLPFEREVRAPIFIVGTGRSGTTVLGLILSIHSEIGFLNEPKALWHVVCPDEDLVGNYTERPGRYVMGADEVTAEARQRANRLHRAYQLMTGCRRVLDKYPELVFRVPYVLGLFRDARFLWIVRGAGATCQSIVRWSAEHGVRSERGTADWWGRDDRKWRLLVQQVAAREPDLAPHTSELIAWTGHEERAALEWLLAMKAGSAAQQRYPEAVMMIRYEDLAADPTGALRDIFDFCGLSHDEVCMRFAASRLRAPRSAPPLRLGEPLGTLVAEMMGSLGYR